MVLHITQQNDLKLKQVQEVLKNQNYSVTDTQYISSEMNRSNAIKKSIERLKDGDTVIVDGIGMLGNSLYTSLKNLIEINKKKADIYLIEENLCFNVDSELFYILYKFLRFERYCLEQRAKAAKQTREKKGIKVGRKKGKKVKSIFDEHKTKIKRYHKLGLSKTKIVEHIGVGTSQALGKYIKKLEDEAEQVKAKKQGDNFNLGLKLMDDKGKLKNK